MIGFDISHIHPMLVHFPIALLLVGFLAELLVRVFKKEVWLVKSSFYLLLLGTLAIVITWLSGMFLTSELSGTAGDVREMHELAATVTMALAILTSALRVYALRQTAAMPKLNTLSFVLYGLIAVCVGLTVALGGTLVYSYMMPL